MTAATTPRIGRLHGIVIDAVEPRTLATFYETLLGMTRVQDDEDWVVIGTAPDQPGIAFQQVEHPIDPPTWPEGERPQYYHFDVMVDDLDAAEESAVAAGATLVHVHSATCRVFTDPVGHPFCLCTE